MSSRETASISSRCFFRVTSSLESFNRSAANRAAVLGYEGKWAIHPSQIDLANQVYTPSQAEVTKARRIMDAMAQAAREGRGAVSLDGRLIDIASIRMAQALIAKADSITEAAASPA